MSEATNLERKLFGERLKLYRKSAGLSVIELAERAQTARQVIYDIEKGNANYTVDQFIKVIRGCGVSVDEFLRGVSAEPTEFHDLFHMLRIIATSGNKDLVHGIRINLEAISEKAVRLQKTRASPGPEIREGQDAVEGYHGRSRKSDGSKRRLKTGTD